MEKRVIVTKRKTYELPADAKGIPAPEFFGNAKLPSNLKTALVYETEDGSVIAMQDAEF